MISVFCGIIFADEPVVKSLGLAFTVSVLVDAFLIRMTLVPAVMVLLGRKAWYKEKASNPQIKLE
ncbi:MMPL family transporter [Cohnella boryungensis]|uniref:MMPL family transporter n=1 Tax=Cohnella boryungensis TaxID=768479 RepID=A0ABV8S864_9BACL